jgi:type I restriction enzyme M protein
MTTSSIVSKVWNYCNILRDDGVSYGDYLEQLTYLLFLKMAYEYSKEPYNRPTIIAKKYDWESLRSINGGAPLKAHYIEILVELGRKKGMLGEIFFKAQNKIQDRQSL